MSGRKSSFAVLILALVSMLWPSVGFSQAVYEVDPIVVTAERISQKARDALSSLTVITRREIEAMHAQDLGEILRLVPGAQVQQYGSYGNLAQLRLRGSESNHLLVLIDGIEVNDPFFGGFDVAHINSDQIERVEVVRGTQTSFFGADAIGGVVNVILRKGDDGGGLSISEELGEYGLRKTAVGLNGKKGSFNYSLNVTHLESDGTNARDSYKNTGVGAVTKLHADPGSSISLGLYYTEYYKALPFSFYYDYSDYNYHQYSDPNNSQEGHLINGYIKMSHVWKGRFKTEVRGAINSSRLRNKNGPDIDPSFENTSLDTRKLDLLLDERIFLNDWSSLTLSWQYQDESASRLDNNLYSSFSSVDKGISFSSLAAALSLNWNERVKSLIGLRNDNPSLFASRLSPQFKVSIKLPRTETRFRAGWSGGFRVPTISDLYFPGFGNADLKPEAANSYETGIDQSLSFLNLSWFKESNLSLILFQVDVMDMIAFNDRTWKSENIAEAHYSGLEIEFSTLLGKRGLFRANYTHQRARELKFAEERRLFRRPKDTVNLFLTVFPLHSLELSARYGSVGDQLVALSFVTSEGEVVRAGDHLNSHAVLDVSATYTPPHAILLTRRTEFYFRIKNVLDENYQEVRGYPALGRTFIVGVKLIF